MEITWRSRSHMQLWMVYCRLFADENTTSLYQLVLRHRPYWLGRMYLIWAPTQSWRTGTSFDADRRCLSRKIKLPPLPTLSQHFFYIPGVASRGISTWWCNEALLVLSSIYKNVSDHFGGKDTSSEPSFRWVSRSTSVDLFLTTRSPGPCTSQILSLRLFFDRRMPAFSPPIYSSNVIKTISRLQVLLV